MKRFQKVLMAMFIIAVCLSTSACTDFKGFDNNSVIISSSSSAWIKSVQNNTAEAYSVSAESFDGVQKVKKMTVPENPVFDVTLTISAGRFKAVLVSSNKVYLICDSDTENKVTVEVPAGEYTLKIVGEKAKVSFVFKYDSYII